MTKTLQQIGEEVDEYLILKHIEREIREPRKKELKRIEKEFVQEITENDPDWVKDRRLEFLNDELKWFNQRCIAMINLFEKYKNYPKQSFEKLMFAGEDEEKESIWPLAKKIKSLNNQINLWNNPNELYAVGWNQLTDDDIQMAREADVSTFIEIKRRDHGRSWAICPFHEDARPSLCIYDDTKQYHCFACNEHGNTIDLVMKLHDVNFKTAVKTILFNL